MSSDRVVLGRVVGAHGVRGLLRVRWLGDGPENLLAMSEIGLADPGRGHEDPAPKIHEVEEGAPGREGEVRLRLRGVADRTAAASLRGCWVVVDRRALPPLSPGEHYWHELLGCRVETTAGAPVGTVREIWETGAHDVLVVSGSDGRERLIPTAGPAIARIDTATRRIVVEDLPGLLEPQNA